MSESFHIRGIAKSIEVPNGILKHYAKGSKERETLLKACEDLRNAETIEIPCIVNGKEVKTGNVVEVKSPGDTKKVLYKVHLATKELMKESIKGALEAKKKWEKMPIDQRASIFFKAADLTKNEYRDLLNATIMINQGKTMWQAEIDLVEMIDFFRFNNSYAMEIYEQQPPKNSPGVWNKVEYRPLEGFVCAISPFNFASIAANLNCSPVLMGNVSLWKPGTTSALSAYRIFQMLKKAGVPDGVIQFLPSSGSEFADVCFSSPDFAGLHFTGSTQTFRTIWKNIASNLEKYKTYPRIVGETGGKNFHMMHESANVINFVNNTLRGSFEFSGQKCSATSRAYVPKSKWEEVKGKLIEGAKSLKVGEPNDPKSFTSCVIDEKAFKKITGYIERAKKDKDCEIIVGGTYSDKKGWYIDPTIIVTKNPKSETMVNEIFGPVLTVYVYESSFEEACKLCDSTGEYGLTGSIFSDCRYAAMKATDLLRNCAGNFYINDKCTGAVVGQQPFGGARLSGTNDKAGASVNLTRWVSMRSIKENFNDLKSPFYPSIDQ